MSDVIGQRISGNLLYVDRAKHLRHIVDATGPDVIKYLAQRFINSGLASADAPVGWTITLVEAGGGESTITKPDGVDGGLLFTTDANEDDGINAQLKGEMFKLNTSCQALYFYARLQASDATQIDWLVGLCITDTTLLGGLTDGIYFEKLDGGTGISFVTEKDSTETQTDALATFAAATDTELEFFYDKAAATVYAFINGVQVAAHTANICDDEDLTPSLHVLAGEAVAKTLALKDMRVVQIGY
jgi:hypothetical protein